MKTPTIAELNHLARVAFMKPTQDKETGRVLDADKVSDEERQSREMTKKPF